MKAIVFHGIGDIRIDDVVEPRIKDPYDAIVRVTASAICGTDLHMIRGSMVGMEKGTILGHEGVGVIEEVGAQVRNFKRGDRVVIPSTIGCGYCSYCRSGYFSQCDHANPNGPHAGTAFFGGPKQSGPFHGMQAEWVRVPYAHVGLVKIPDAVSDDQAILLSDIFPTGYFGAALAEIKSGETVCVFGCGPVGLFAIISAYHMGAGRVIAVDHIPYRLDRARSLGAEVINFDEEDPVETLQELTGGIGPDRIIDAVGVDAQAPVTGPAVKKSKMYREEFDRELRAVAPKARIHDQHWIPGDAPSQALIWAVESVAKAGTISIVGVYPETVQFFPLGQAMNRNLTVNMGNCNHRKYIPYLLELVESRVVEPNMILSHAEPLQSAIEAYEAFDERQEGWIKVELFPTQRESLV